MTTMSRRKLIKQLDVDKIREAIIAAKREGETLLAQMQAVRELEDGG